MDPAKLKVVELRAELSARGLDIKGVKAVLVERLKQALEEETGEEVPDTSIIETSTEETSFIEDKVDNSEPEKDNSEPDQDNTPESEEVQDQPPEEENEGSEEPYQESEQDNDVSQRDREPTPEAERESTPEPSQGEFGDKENTYDSENYGSEVYQSESYQSAPAAEQEKEAESRDDQKVEEESEKSQDIEMENVAIKQEKFGDDFKQDNYEEKPDISQYQGYDQGFDKKEHYEAEVKMEPGVEVKEERDDRQEDRKRKRSRWSPQPQQKQGWGQRPDWGRKDDEPELDENAMVLGWYDSDLNLEINKEDFLEAGPMSAQGFGYIWAGVRATFGFSQGKVCYEVKLLEDHDVTHLEDEPSPHVLRVGWSTLDTNMMLGEEPKSYGYGGTGKISTNCKFSNYGTSFVVGDVVTAYLDYGESVKISYAVNGQYLGDAFNFSPDEVDNKPLFPHILSKNIKFRVNFGMSDPQFPVEPEYTWAAHVPVDQRVPGPRRPERREDCEMLMMCGLPGCGKTTWANAYVREQPDKFYNILGTNNLIDKMKIQGLPRKRNYSGRWDVLIDKCTKCLNKLLELAARRRRNYILDQTNVYPSAQKRKMRNFGGFIRRAIVIVPPDEEFQRRCEKREAEEGKDIPDSAVLEMKANFRLPEEGEHFDEVRFIELSREESLPLVEQYNKEGRAAGFGQQTPFSGQGGKKFRPNDRPPFRGGGFRGGRGGFGGGMDRKDRGQDRGPGGRGGFRSGGMDRGGRGSWGPRGGGPDRGPPRGGWRDRSPPGGGFDRDMDSRPPGGGPWRSQRGGDRDRPYDRNQRGGRGGGNFRDNDYGNRGGGFRDGGYDRDDYRGGYNNREDGFRDGRGGGRGGPGGRGGRGGFDRDNKGGGRGGFDRNRGGFNDRRGGGNRDGGFDRNRGDRGPRDNKGGGGGGGGQGSQGGNQGWGNQTYQGGWGQQGGYNNQQGYNQGYNQGYQGYNQQQATAQQGWGQQAWGNKGTGQQQAVAGAAGATATPAATGYNTTGYAQQPTGYNQAAGYQGYWGQYGYGQGWTQNADGTYSYPQGWQGYGYNYASAMTPAAGATAATPGAAAATPAAPQAPAAK